MTTMLCSSVETVRMPLITWFIVKR